MATPSAIAVTGDAIVGLLEDARPQAIFPDLHFRLYQTGELQTPRQTLKEVVSVCAYRVAFNTARRNLPPRVDPNPPPDRRSSLPPRFRPSVPVDVYFLVTAWAQDPAQQLRILGWVIRTLEDAPSLPASFLNRFGGEARVFRPDESVDLVADGVSQQDLYTIWQVAPTRQQPSVVYVARLVQLDSTIQLGDSRAVQTRRIDLEEVPRAMNAFVPATRPLERLEITSPLGLRFWDVGAGKPADGGLRVTATAPNGRVITAVENRSGASVFATLPGIRTHPAPAGTDFFANPPAAVTFVVQVVDPFRRFLPVQFEVNAPVDDFFELPGSPPAQPEKYVPLFSAPWRVPPAGCATVRAELADSASGRPAAWALLEVEAASGAETVHARGLADEKGRVVVFLPWPESPDAAVESLPHAVRRLTDLTWPLGLGVRYQPALSPPESAAPPLLTAILAQHAGMLIETVSPPVSLTAATLQFGRELLLHSGGPAPQPATLFVQS